MESSNKGKWDVSTKWPDIKAHLKDTLEKYRTGLESIKITREEDITLKSKIALLRELLAKEAQQDN